MQFIRRLWGTLAQGAPGCSLGDQPINDPNYLAPGAANNPRPSFADWRPIATAPRNGTHVLLAFGQDWVSSAAYNAENAAYPWVFLDDLRQGRPASNQARDDGEHGPSHWAPLPPAPGARK